MSSDRPLPLYAQVKQYLLARIAAGEGRDGARLPSEHELMQLLGASRMTVHRALREMSAEGLLRRVQGVGTFAGRPRPQADLLEITDIADDILKRGHVHTCRVITSGTIRAGAAKAAQFGLRRGGRLFHSEFVHDQDGVPIQYEQRLIVPGFAPDYLKQDFSKQTVSRYLQSIAPPDEIEHSVDAIAADDRIAAWLRLDPAAPCLRLRRRTWVDHVPVTASTLIYPGTRYRLASRYKPG